MLRERRRHANFKPNRKLDRKSSRGMIYENEELRLRTININAEVERGQSDIKKLRRENYQLRREIWTLRDEYDRLGKLLKNKCDPYENANSSCSYDCGRSASDCKRGSEYGDACRCSCCIDDDSVSCDMCNENDQCNSKNVDDRTMAKSSTGDKANTGYGMINANKSNAITSSPKAQRSEKIDMNFDHLSVVSEECLSNSEDQSNKNSGSSSNQPQKNNDSSTSKCELNRNDTLEGIDESIYASFQSTIPPLKHFENLSYKDIGPNIESLSDIQFNGEMYQASEPTPPPPTPPPLPTANRKSSSLPLPPPPTMADDGSVVIQQDNSNENEPSSSSAIEKPKYFFAPLKSKRKSSISSSAVAAAASADGKTEMRPDVLLVNNVMPSDGNRLATIRKPHNPLKYPSNTNAASIDPEETGELDNILQDIHGLSKGIETMQMQQKNANTYENVKRAKSTTSSDSSDHSHPYRTEMSLILSYNGNKSKYSTNKSTDKSQESDTLTDTPPPNLPQAMKLFPNKLMYTPSNNNNSNELFKSTQSIGQESDLANENIDNSANEKMLTKSQTNLAHDSGAVSRNGDKKSSNGKCREMNDDGGENDELKTISTAPKRDNNESAPILKTTNSNGTTSYATAQKDANDDHHHSSKKSSPSGSVKDGKSRRVSIHFNGIPMSDELETDQHSNNDSDDQMTSVAEKVAEELVSAAISCRRASRRFSCSRKLSEDSIGSFLYPPNPFGFVGGGVGSSGSKRDGRKMSFLSRRHSDGLVPAHRNQYHTDYETPKKSSSRYHCHRNHLQHNHHLNPDHLCNFGESTATSICNSMASSRESLGSAIDSQRSSRRKMSITSHSKSGGKIPWCACWGNGCL